MDSWGQSVRVQTKIINKKDGQMLESKTVHYY